MKGWGKEIGDSLTLGFELVIPALLLALGGYHVDKRISTFPAGLIIGLFFGAAIGFWNVIRKYLK